MKGKGIKKTAEKTSLDVFFESLNFHVDVRPRDGSISLSRLIEYIDVPQRTHTRIVAETLEAHRNHPLISRLFDLTQYGDITAFKRQIEEEAARNHKSIYSQLVHPDLPGKDQDKTSMLNKDLVDLNTLLSFPESELSSYTEAYYLLMITSRIINNLLFFEVDPLLILLTEKTAFHISNKKLQEMLNSISELDRNKLSSILGDSEDLYHKTLGAVIDNNEEYFKNTLHDSMSSGFQLNVDMTLTLAVRYSRDNIVKYALKQYIKYKSIVSTTTDDFYEKLVINAGYAMIRGDEEICKLFMQPQIWILYQPEDQLRILNLIVSRSGERTRDILIQDLYANNLLKLELYNTIISNTADKFKAEILGIFEPFYEDIVKNYIKDELKAKPKAKAEAKAKAAAKIEGYYKFIALVFEYRNTIDKASFISTKFDQIKDSLTVNNIDRTKLPDFLEFADFLARLDREDATRWLIQQESLQEALSQKTVSKTKPKPLEKPKPKKLESEKPSPVTPKTIAEASLNQAKDEDTNDDWIKVSYKTEKPRPKPKPKKLTSEECQATLIIEEEAAAKPSPKLEEISSKPDNDEDGDSGKARILASIDELSVIIPDNFLLQELPTLTFGDFGDDSKTPAIVPTSVNKAKDPTVVKLEKEIKKLQNKFDEMSTKYQHIKWELDELREAAASQEFQYYDSSVAMVPTTGGYALLKSDNIYDINGYTLMIELWQNLANGEIFQYFRDPLTGLQVFPTFAPNIQAADDSTVDNSETDGTTQESSGSNSQKAEGESTESIGREQQEEKLTQALSFTSEAPKEIILAISTKLTLERPINPKEQEDKESIEEAQRQLEESLVAHIKYENVDMYNASYVPSKDQALAKIPFSIIRDPLFLEDNVVKMQGAAIHNDWGLHFF